MQTKSITIVEMDEAGKGLARLAQLSAIDNDGDTYAPAAFSWPTAGHQWASMIPAHDRRKMPFGKARIFEDDDWAFAELNLNLDTQVGRDWHSTLKFDLDRGDPVQEWSYGYEVLDADHAQRGRDWRRKLKRVKVDEVSPVLRGAGIGTRTLSMKGAALKSAHFAPLIASLGELADALPDDPAVLSATGLKQLREIEAAIGAVLSGTKAASCSTCKGEFDPKDLTEGLCGPCGAAAVAGKGLEGAALAAFTKHLVRRNLPAEA